MGIKSHADVWGAFVPGKDIAVPTADENWKREFCPTETQAQTPGGGGGGDDEGEGEEDKEERKQKEKEGSSSFEITFRPGKQSGGGTFVETDPLYERPVMVYFTGSVERQPSMAPLNMRVEIVKSLKGVPGWYVHDRNDGGGDAVERAKFGGGEVSRFDMSTANFCLAPQGTSGGWTVREINGIKAGCIPVYIQPRVTTYFEEYMPRDLYQIALPYEEEEVRRMLPELPKQIAEVWKNKSEVSRLRRQGRCACEHLQTSNYGVKAEDWWDPRSEWFDVDDRRGVFRTLMATLRMRMDPTFGPVADACAL